MSSNYLATKNNVIKNRAAIFHARTYWALLYETDSNTPQLVRVPVYLGKTSANSLDDLDTDIWIRNGSCFTQCIDLDENRLHPPPPTYARHSNRAIKHISGNTIDKWHSNVLVVCHGKRSAVAGVQMKHVSYINKRIIRGLSFVMRENTRTSRLENVKPCQIMFVLFYPFSISDREINSDSQVSGVAAPHFVSYQENFTMAFSGPAVRNRLIHTAQYCASPNWNSRVGWANSRSGQILVDAKSGDEMFCIVVGTVSETRFKMGPVGNYNPEFNKLKDAKYTFGLDEPTNPDFRPDWATTVKALEDAENMIQGTKDHRHFIEKVGNLRSLRLSARVLQEKDPGVSDEIKLSHWPAPPEYRDALVDLEDTHTVAPLMAYNEKESQILPEELPSILKGTLVEVTFTLRHYRIKNATQDNDTYTGTIEQIIILERAPPKKISPYRKGGGPIRARPSNVPSREEQAAAVRAFSWSRPTLRDPPPATQTAGSSVDVPAKGNLIANIASPSFHNVQEPEAEASYIPVAVTDDHITSSIITISPTPALGQTTSLSPTTFPAVPPSAAVAGPSMTSSVAHPETHNTSSPTNNPVPPSGTPETQNIRTRQTLIIPSLKALGKRKADETIDDERPTKKSSK
ncbi:uncharacterized protein LACBIDRAFT_327239 [Laccaria bicolor S238N-H82]|uniref:Predicted protein n=1 Tax=Laccaria bicolor (strain S238N-H82 / ATCC MYA-4686) TaxID=486041 RepID=B0DBK9_LACBS|nr:uncharacterized protein LACBIDRAFT_327239 [Laccaria bicolor S238N-H82]EDR08202.1 predicted protein [Laccaria bicolor S238N-H82]|eukprot:XP_001881272.1 predicted protein [Laccaria bicolor S238N-H82]